jgi:transposase InsO family protein
MDAGQAEAVFEVGRMHALCVLCTTEPARRKLSAPSSRRADAGIRAPTKRRSFRDLLSFALFEYIEAFYDRQTRHSTLGMVSPAEYEQTQTRATYSKIKQPTT